MNFLSFHSFLSDFPLWIALKIWFLTPAVHTIAEFNVLLVRFSFGFNSRHATPLFNNPNETKHKHSKILSFAQICVRLGDLYLCSLLFLKLLCIRCWSCFRFVFVFFEFFAFSPFILPFRLLFSRKISRLCFGLRQKWLKLHLSNDFFCLVLLLKNLHRWFNYVMIIVNLTAENDNFFDFPSFFSFVFTRRRQQQFFLLLLLCIQITK